MSDTTATNVVTISPGQASISLDLRNNTALIGCVKVDSDDSGRLIFVKPGYKLSSGEELLWLVLGWLNGHNWLPERDDLVAGLDATNLAAVDLIVKSQRGEVA